MRLKVVVVSCRSCCFVVDTKGWTPRALNRFRQSVLLKIAAGGIVLTLLSACVSAFVIKALLGEQEVPEEWEGRRRGSVLKRRCL